MYLDKIPENVKTTTLVQIKYDCCQKERSIKFCDARANFQKNNNKHICRPCWLRTNNPAKSKEVQDKIKKTNLEKYGTTLPINSKENIEARNKKMFGSEEAVKEIVAKRRQTNRKKYGSDHPMQNDDIKAKQQAVLTEKYGTHVPLKNNEVKAKMQKTVQERYGVTNVAMLPEVRAKMAKTMYENYGVEHYNQLPEMKDYLRENCPQWLQESWENPWAKGITRPEEWNQKQRETVANLIKNGNWSGGFKSNCRGKYFARKCRKNSPRFLSSLELKMHFFLDNNPNVEWYDYECLAIPYIKKEGTKHLYFPDFLVKFFDNPYEHIIETKTWKEKDSINVQIKQNAAIDYADEHKMIYVLMFDEDVDRLVDIDFELIKSVPQVQLY
jgi:hypothetical protein